MKQFDGSSYPDAAAPPHALYLAGRDGVEEPVMVANLDWKVVHAGIDAVLNRIGEYGGIPYAERVDGLDSSIAEYDVCQEPSGSSTVYTVYAYAGPEVFESEDIGRLAADPRAQRLFEIIVDDAEEEYLQALRELQEVAGDSFDPSIGDVEEAVEAAHDAALVCEKFGTYDRREFHPDVVDALRGTPYRRNADGGIEARVDVGNIRDDLERQSEGVYTIVFCYSVDDERTWVSSEERVYVTEDGQMFLEDGHDRLLNDTPLTPDQIAAVDVVLEDALAWIDIKPSDPLDAAEAKGE